jgi:hypothetical protein
LKAGQSQLGGFEIREQNFPVKQFSFEKWAALRPPLLKDSQGLFFPFSKAFCNFESFLR